MIAADVVRPVTITPAQSLPAAVPSAAPAKPDGRLSFDDLIDIVNPLQHIPVVGTLYRAITGDTIKTFPKIAGDTLYGGFEGFAGSVADMVFEKVTGKSFGDTAYEVADNLFNGRAPFNDGTPDAGDATAPNAVASNAAPSLLERIEHLFSSSPAQAPVTAVAANAPIDTTATPVASSAPALTAPAVVAGASLDTLVIPGQDTLFNAIRSVGNGAEAALRGSTTYRRAAAAHAVNTGLQTPALRATLN